MHDIKRVTDVMGNAAIKRTSPSYKTKTRRRRRKLQHLFLDKVYNSKPEEQELIKRGYVLHYLQREKR